MSVGKCIVLRPSSGHPLIQNLVSGVRGFNLHPVSVNFMQSIFSKFVDQSRWTYITRCQSQNRCDAVQNAKRLGRYLQPLFLENAKPMFPPFKGIPCVADTSKLLSPSGASTTLKNATSRRTASCSSSTAVSSAQSWCTHCFKRLRFFRSFLSCD